MWLFKSKKNNTNKPLIAIRYTYDAFHSLFPKKTQQDWENENFPDNMSAFIKHYVIQHMSHKNKKVERILVATIDNKYIKWLKQNNKTHSTNTLDAYINYCGTNSCFWSQMLIKSNMTTSYNVLGIPSMVMLYNFDGYQSQYTLSKDTSDKISLLLKDIYDSDYVFVPGWITKGSEMPKYNQDIIQMAKSFWDNGMRVRFGKYLEQNYSQYELFNKFIPLHFVVPFVVKTQITNAEINLSGVDYSKNDKIEHAMTSIAFLDETRIKLFNLISSEIPQVVSVGTNAIMSGQAYVLYQNNIMQRCFKTKNVSMY